MLILAVAGIVVVAFAHSYMGEKNLIAPLLRRDNLPVILGSIEMTRATLRVAWHVTSLNWLGIAAVLLYLQFNTTHLEQVVLWATCGMFAASGVVAIIAGRGKHLAWIPFLVVAVMTAMAAVQRLGG